MCAIMMMYIVCTKCIKALNRDINYLVSFYRYFSTLATKMETKSQKLHTHQHPFQIHTIKDETTLQTKNSSKILVWTKVKRRQLYPHKNSPQVPQRIS